jgi:transposase
MQLKKRPKESAKPIKRRTGARHVGKRKAADIWHDSTRRTSGHSDAGKCSASQPLIQSTIAPGTLIYTDEYAIYDRLEQWGYSRKSVCHGAGEYARDEDGDGFYEVHVNTMEGFWSLLRSWLRPHRGISQAYLPIYLGFFEFVHNAKKRGKALLSSLLELIMS